MMNLIKKVIRILLDKRKLKLVSEHELMKQKLISGKILVNLQKNIPIKKLSDAEFSIFSQWGDDGIIQFLIARLPSIPKIFIEFGVENYRESNTRFLLCHNNWRGLIFDGSAENINFVRRETIYFDFSLTALPLFVTAENINENIEKAGFSDEIGILHIDIDGNDYWVWKALFCINPAIVIMEYNSGFGSERAITVPYDADFQRTKAHHSNLYFGASLRALVGLAKEKGYTFIGSNSNGVNAYFLRNDLMPEMQEFATDAESGYVRSMFRECRDENGNLTFENTFEVMKKLRGLQVFNTEKQCLENLTN